MNSNGELNHHLRNTRYYIEWQKELLIQIFCIVFRLVLVEREFNNVVHIINHIIPLIQCCNYEGSQYSKKKILQTLQKTRSIAAFKKTQL